MLEWCAKLYEDSNFLGWEITIFEGATNLGLDHDDLVSSVKINSGCALTLYDHLYQNGFLDTLTTDDTFIEAYNDQVSSVWCTCTSGNTYFETVIIKVKTILYMNAFLHPLKDWSVYLKCDEGKF